MNQNIVKKPALNSKKPAQKFAYITMWIDRSELPREWEKHTKDPKYARKFITTEESAMTTVESILDEIAPDETQNVRKGLNKDSYMVGGKDAIWALAKNMAARGSKYPLVILTNDKTGVLWEKVALKAKYPNIEIVELKKPLEPVCPMRQATQTHFQKLNILGMEQYDKLLWIDVDVRLRRNIDYLFDQDVESTTYFMKDDWYCGKQELTNGGFSSGLMLFKPNLKLLDHVLEKARQMADCWGDQVIIQHALKTAFVDYDGQKKKIEKKWFPQQAVQYPQCDDKWKADAVHFVKIKKNFVTPDEVFSPGTVAA